MRLSPCFFVFALLEVCRPRFLLGVSSQSWAFIQSPGPSPPTLQLQRLLYSTAPYCTLRVSLASLRIWLAFKRGRLAQGPTWYLHAGDHSLLAALPLFFPQSSIIVPTARPMPQHGTHALPFVTCMQDWTLSGRGGRVQTPTRIEVAVSQSRRLPPREARRQRRSDCDEAAAQSQEQHMAGRAASRGHVGPCPRLDMCCSATVTVVACG